MIGRREENPQISQISQIKKGATRHASALQQVKVKKPLIGLFEKPVSSLNLRNLRNLWIPFCPENGL